MATYYKFLDKRSKTAKKFPLLNDTLDDKEQEARNKKIFELKINRRRSYHISRLKELSKRAGLEDNISTYVGRHSFFSIALRNGVSKSEISELAGHADFQTTEHYLAGFNGEQLAASANIVRNAVAKHTSSGTGVLEDTITRNDNGQEQTLIDFFNETWLNTSEQEHTAKHLMIALLQETNLQDFTKAQQSVNHFLQIQESTVPQ